MKNDIVLKESPYRVIDVPKEEKPKAKLVRANGSACWCTPPNALVRLWYGIHNGDEWHCKHGGRWVSLGICGEPFWTAKK